MKIAFCYNLEPECCIKSNSLEEEGKGQILNELNM